MKITYLGHSCFCFEAKDGTKLITDPYTRVGYELPRGLTADIVLVSHGHFDHAYLNAIGGMPTVLSESGNYTIKGISVKGMDTWHDPKQGALRGKNVVFQFVMDGITFCHFGDLGEEYSDKTAQAVSDADVWLIPVGGTYTIDALQAREYADKLMPKLLIPMHYRPADGGLDIAPIADFLSKVQPEKVIACPDGEYLLTADKIEDMAGEILYMERSK
ncbi:MAG: MBL fold metallo-hydrolase [Clostridiales bacterium]|nr:MBL fold metallo-hydrolase [Clostridiales bacterium]